MTWELRADARRLIRRQGAVLGAITVLALLFGMFDRPSLIAAIPAGAMLLIVLVRAPAMALRIENGSAVVTNMFGRTEVPLGSISRVVVEQRRRWYTRVSVAAVALETDEKMVWVEAASWQPQPLDDVAEQIRDALRTNGALIP